MRPQVRWVFVAVVSLTVLVLDQWTKFLAVEALTPGMAMARAKAITEGRAENGAEPTFFEKVGYYYSDIENPCTHRGSVYPRCEEIKYVDGFWSFRYVENRGAAWGLLSRTSDSFRIPFFFAVMIAALVFIFSFLRKLTDDQRMMAWGLSLVLGGAFGNFVDRMHLQYVIDFIDWYSGNFHWPTFNVADVGISTGVGLLLLDGLLDWLNKRKETRVEPTSEASGAR